MEVQLTPALESKLIHLAEQQGRGSAELVAEAVERMVNFDQWFMSEVEQGLDAANHGDVVDHSTVRTLIEHRYAS